MDRKEALQKEHDARVGRVRLDSALPPMMRRRRGYGRLVFGVILLLLAAGVAGWLVFGR